jgi:hypothetical protein
LKGLYLIDLLLLGSPKIIKEILEMRTVKSFITLLESGKISPVCMFKRIHPSPLKVLMHSFYSKAIDAVEQEKEHRQHQTGTLPASSQGH